MFNGLIAILTLMSHIYQTYGSCENSILLPELAKRSRTYKADADGTQGSDPIVVDNFLSPQWYNVSFDGQQYLMPDANSMPAYEQCGTIQPIYLSGTHPDIDTLTEVPQTFITCELYPHNDCENKIEIQIRICDGSVQYYLPRTSNNAAYCFDPPDLQNVTDFSEAPTESIGTLTVKSELRFKEVSTSLLPYIAFVCTESGGTDRGSKNLFYFTYWYIDGVIEFVQKGYEGIGNLTEDSLLSRGFSLGIMIQCGVKLARNATGLMTKLFKSESFFAGIRIEETLITMSSNEIKSLKIQPTVPYGCYALKDRPTPTASCRTKVHLFSPERDRCVLSDTNLGAQNIKSLQALCGFEILGCYPGDPECSVTKQTSAMNITTRFLSYDDPKSYVLRLVTQSAGTHEIWKGSVLDDVVVNIDDDDIDFKDKVCFSHVDPHMCTGDGKIYDNNEFAGEFILYWNTEYNIVIQEKTTSCFSESEDKGPFCTCAVAIRAGGDIFLINLCNDLKFIGMTACKDNGALVIRKQDEFNYQVETHIGTLVKIRIRPKPSTLDYTNLMNIDIVMAPKDFNSTKGLCGIVDSIKENDYHDRNGKALDDSEEFINSWKIGPEDTNYLNLTCNSNVRTWEEDGEQLFCTCDCFSDDSSSTCRTLNPEAVCSPTQYINCTVELQKTDDLCSNFRDKCLPENRKKRSFTVDPDLEMQRRAKLADTTNNLRRKRQTNEQENISNEQAIDICTNAIGQSIASKNFSNLLEGYVDTSHIMEHCRYDVSVSQDRTWSEAHVEVMKDAVQIGFKRNANFTETHRDSLISFKKQSCSSNCNDKGPCTEEGRCVCENDYYGVDCRYDIKVPPTIEDVEGGGLCDRRYGSECRCSEIQMDMLRDPFHCKRIVKIVSSNGTLTTVDESIVNGIFINLFTGECCFEYHWKKRPLTEVMFYEFEVSVSNDGNNFGQAVTLHVYDSSCQEYFTDIQGQARVVLKDGMCFIDNECVTKNEARINDNCYKCLPSSNRFDWTHDCQNKDKDDDKNILLTIVLPVLGSIIGLFIIIYIVRKCVTRINRRIDSNSAAQYEDIHTDPNDDNAAQYQAINPSNISLQDLRTHENSSDEARL